MPKRTRFAPKQRVFNHKRYTLYPHYFNIKKNAEKHAKQLRADQVVMGFRFITNARAVKFGDEWVVYYWENRCFSKKRGRIVKR